MIEYEILKLEVPVGNPLCVNISDSEQNPLEKGPADRRGKLPGHSPVLAEVSLLHIFQDDTWPPLYIAIIS